MSRTVLRRELTPEEARAIGAGMVCQNKDGVVSIVEFAQWCEANSIVKVKLAEEEWEKDLDEMVTERVQDQWKLKE